jgi:23S rRNA-/tRNA-specific pseudouridylate synthase
MHPTADRARPSLTTALESWLAAAGRAIRLGVHQRLDRDTSGVVAFALSPAANRGLAAAFATHAVEKTYHALTVRPRGRVPAAWEDATPVEGRPAHTAFRVERALSHALLVEARPRTGRRHQVRVHLAGAGLPLLGDIAHGGPPASRVFLHARGLVLPHPVTGEPLRLESPWPADFQAAVEAGGAVGPLVPAR